MLSNGLIGFALLIGYYIAGGVPVILIKAYSNIPFEVARKLYHILFTLSIFPLVTVFDTWYLALLGMLVMTLLVYPLLIVAEKAAAYQRIAVERKNGEFKSSFIIAQLSIATLIFIFWGLLGDAWQYVAVVAVLAWGFGDAAAALVGKKLGRRRIEHPQIEGAKTVEGTSAMFIVAALAIFLTLLLYADQSWVVSLSVALVVAPVSAIVELFSHKGLDTLTVPLSVAFLVVPLMSFFSYLGI